MLGLELFEFVIELASNSYGLLCPDHKVSQCSEPRKTCSVINVTAKFAQFKDSEARSGSLPSFKHHQQKELAACCRSLPLYL